MQLGMIGLGRMGANMVRRLLKGGHHCVVFDRSAQAVAELEKEKAIGAGSLAEFAKRLAKPRAIWLMVPVGAVDDTIADLLPHLAIDEGVPVPVLSVALYERFSSRGEADFADKLLSAMRYEFGGHVEKPAAKRAG
jgi:6-phosphogluconate dehydrogenase (decarboxylating)